MNSPRQKLATDSDQNSVRPFSVKIGCGHHLLTGFRVQSRKSIFDAVAVKSPNVSRFHANQRPIGTAAHPINIATGARSRRNVLRLLKRLIAKIKASPATNRSAMFVALPKHVAASARPVQIETSRVGRSAARNFSNPTKAIPKQSGERESLVIEYNVLCGQIASSNATATRMNGSSENTSFAATKPSQTRLAATKTFRKRTQYNNQPPVRPTTRPRFNHRPATA